MFCPCGRGRRRENIAPHIAMRLTRPGEHADARRDRHDRDVAVGDVAELVGQHGLELLVVQPVHQAARRADDRVVGLRPVAKALGMSISATPTRGFFMSASRQSRSTISCSWAPVRA